MEQFFIRGDIIQEFTEGKPGELFRNHGCADGELIERLLARNPTGFRYVQNTAVNWNILPK
jgi:hypothetical protein